MFSCICFSTLNTLTYISQSTQAHGLQKSRCSFVETTIWTKNIHFKLTNTHYTQHIQPIIQLTNEERRIAKYNYNWNKRWTKKKKKKPVMASGALKIVSSLARLGAGVFEATYLLVSLYYFMHLPVLACTSDTISAHHQSF